MSGGGAVSRKRDLFRGILRNKSSPATTSTAQSTASPAPQAAPSSSAPVVQVSLPFYVRCKFLDQSLQELTPEERAVIREYQVQGSDGISAVVDDAYAAALAKKKACEDKRWRLKVRGRDVVLRDEAEKVVRGLEKFKSVGDVIANVDPLHVGLPWAGIRIILQVTVAESAQMAALLNGMNLGLHMANRLKVYIDYRERVPLSLALDNFEKDLVKMYAVLLKFFASAIRVYQNNMATRILMAFWQTSDLEGFESECERWALRAEIEASNCDRELNAQSWQNAKKWKEDLDSQLQALRNIQDISDSLALLHDKVDLAKLMTASGAMYDSFADRSHGTCLNGTRTQMLSSVTDWAKDAQGKPIFWLCGKAGTGKSTIARTIARTFDKDWQCLGASFFFERGEGHRGNASRFFPTIAEQLAKKIEGMAHAIAEALDKDPRLCEKTLQDQYDNLISQPLQNANNVNMGGPGLIIVIDAMDECEHSTDIRVILRLLAKVEKDASLRLRIFVTSRPELPITLGFREMSGNLHEDVRLEEVQAATIDHDIRLYLEHEFGEIRKDRSLKRPYDALPTGWPGEDAVNELVALAVPLFIFATTVCRFISLANPTKRLESILRQQTTVMFSGLEKTYLPILNQLVLEKEQVTSEQMIVDFRRVVGSIVLLAEPLSVSALGRLLEIDCEDIDDLLEHFHSVLDIPQNRSTPVRLLHLSFRDFLVGEGKQERNKFRIDAALTHDHLAKHCLRLLDQTLKEDLCNVRKPGIRRTDLDEQRIADYFPPDIAYACSYWVWHLEQSKVKLCDGDQVHVFVQVHFLHWLEALSWLGRLSSVIASIATLQSLIQVGKSDRLTTFLNEARRFALLNRYIVSLGPLQVYHSALIFAPRRSVVKQCFQEQSKMLLSRLPEVASDWGSELHILEGHTKNVTAVAFSPAEQILASTSYDCSIRLWKISTGEEIWKLEGNRYRVRAIAFSPEKPDQVLASASEDRTIRLWDFTTGEELRKFEGHDDDVWDVVFSPDGLMLASASRDRTARLWSVTTGVELHKFVHGMGIRKVAFSPDQQLLALGTEFGEIQIWDLASRAKLRRLEGHRSTIHSMTFLRNGQLLTSSQNDSGIWLWNVTNNEVISKLGEWHGKIYCAAASSDRHSFVSAFAKGTVRQQNIGAGEETYELKVDKPVDAIALSQDAGVVALACGRAVHVCDTTVYDDNRNSRGHLRRVNTVVISPCERVFASASDDATVRLWSTASGEETHVLKGHLRSVRELAFSHNGEILASGSLDKTARLWSATSGQCVCTFECEDYINDISFSPDGDLVALQCEGTLQVWVISTREQKYRLDQNHGRALAFSTDGQVLAAVTDSGVITMWSAGTGDFFQRLELRKDPSSTFGLKKGCLSFRHDNKALRLAVRSGYSNEFEEVEVEISSGALYKPTPADHQTLHHDPAEAWIKYRGQDCLWLPSAYRGSAFEQDRSAVFGSRLFICQESGAVSFFDFDLQKLESMFNDSA